jgi:hypothetical protein
MYKLAGCPNADIVQVKVFAKASSMRGVDHFHDQI